MELENLAMNYQTLKLNLQKLWEVRDRDIIGEKYLKMRERERVMKNYKIKIKGEKKILNTYID